MNFYGIEKKTVLVTGSSRGIGRAIALAFGRAGYNVALNASKSAAQLEETKSLLESEAIPVLAVLADVSDYEGCKLLFAKIEEPSVWWMFWSITQAFPISGCLRI